MILLASCQESFDRRLQREAAEYTAKHCPEFPEPGTRLDSVSYDIPTRCYSFWYALSSENETVISANIPLLHQTLLTRLKADVDYKSLKDRNVVFQYTYTSQASGRKIFQTKIYPKEYKNS